MAVWGFRYGVSDYTLKKPRTLVRGVFTKRQIIDYLDKCAEKYHNEEEDEEEHYLLPLANSPRSGICGYEPSAPLDRLF